MHNILGGLMLFANILVLIFAMSMVYVQHHKPEEKSVQMLILNDQQSIPPDKIESYTINNGAIRIVLKNHSVITASHFILAEE